MARWLVTTSRSLLLVDAESAQGHAVHEGAGLYYGLAAACGVVEGAALLVAARRRMVSSGDPVEAERGCVLAFDRQLRLVGELAAPFPLRDLHGIMAREGTLWAACAYDNMVALYAKGRWEAWHPLGESASGVRDLNHFNTLGWFDGRLALVAHNRDSGPSEILLFDWPSRTLHSRVALGWQAHNVWVEAGAWATCSSGEGRLVGSAGFRLDTGGFPRGVGFAPGETCVGISERAERGARDLSRGRLQVYDREWKQRRTVWLEGEGLVLDVLPLEAAGVQSSSNERSARRLCATLEVSVSTTSSAATGGS